MEHIAHQPLDSIAPDFRLVGCQPLPGPADHGVRQRAQQHQHLLRGTALLVVLGQAQARFVILAGRLNPAAPIIGELDVGRRDRLVIEHPFPCLAGFLDHRAGAQGRDHGRIFPAPVLAWPADGATVPIAPILGCGSGDPADLTVGDVRVRQPLRDGLAQLARAAANSPWYRSDSHACAAS